MLRFNFTFIFDPRIRSSSEESSVEYGYVFYWFSIYTAF